MKEDLQNCIKVCMECHDFCQETLFSHCLEMGNEYAEKEHVRLMADCIEICQTTANFMQRDSKLHMLICEACAQICQACADSCDRIEGEKMKLCAEHCRKCADHCRKMSEMKKAA